MDRTVIIEPLVFPSSLQALSRDRYRPLEQGVNGSIQGDEPEDIAFVVARHELGLARQQSAAPPADALYHFDPTGEGIHEVSQEPDAVEAIAAVVGEHSPKVLFDGAQRKVIAVDVRDDRD
jgi:hypothetical protein